MFGHLVIASRLFSFEVSISKKDSNTVLKKPRLFKFLFWKKINSKLIILTFLVFFIE